MQQVAECGGVAVPRPDLRASAGRQLLLDCLFQHRTAHDGAGRVKPEEITARGLIEIAVGFIGAGGGNDALAQLGGARDRRFDHFQQFQGKRGAQQVVLLGIEGALNLLPGGRLPARRRLAAAGSARSGAGAHAE